MKHLKKNPSSSSKDFAIKLPDYKDNVKVHILGACPCIKDTAVEVDVDVLLDPQGQEDDQLFAETPSKVRRLSGGKSFRQILITFDRLSESGVSEL